MSIKKDLASGVFFIGIAKYSGMAVSLAVTAVLSRLLTPEDYGIIAVAMVFITFFNILSDIGIGPAIIQYKNLTDDDCDSIFSFTVYSGLTLGLLFFLCAVPIATYYDNDSLTSVCRLLSLVVVFSCINIVPTNLLYKSKRFKFIAASNLAVQLLTGVASIIYALYGGGVNALMITPVCTPLILFLLFNRRTRLHFSPRVNKASMMKIVAFSSYQFLFNIVNYFSRNMDKLLVGKYIGLSQLGQYEKSYRMMMLPLQNITYVMTPVLHPVFSEMQNDFKSLASCYCRMLNYLAYIAFPLTAFLYFSASQLIILLFGNQWTAAIEPFRILSLSVALQILTSTTASIFQAANSTRRLFATGLIVSVIMVTAFIIAIATTGTITAVAYAFLIAKALDMAISYTSLFSLLHHPLSALLKVLVKPVFTGIIIFAALFFTNKILYQADIHDIIVTLAVNLCVTGMLTIVMTQMLGEIDLIKQTKQIFKRK